MTSGEKDTHPRCPQCDLLLEINTKFGKRTRVLEHDPESLRPSTTPAAPNLSLEGCATQSSGAPADKEKKRVLVI